MARLALDATTLLHIVTAEVEVDPAHQLVGVNAIRSQVLQRLLDDVRAGALTEQQALACHERMTRLPLRLLGDRVSRVTAWKLAIEHGWSIAQAEPVAIALLQADGLVTIDADFGAHAASVVPVLPLRALGPG